MNKQNDSFGTFLVGTDPGIDDLISLALLQKLSPSFEHRLLPTFGNVTGDIAQANCLEYIDYCAPHWSCSKTISFPLNNSIEHAIPDYFHGKDGLWNMHISDRSAKDISSTKKSVSETDNIDKYKDAMSFGPMTCFSKPEKFSVTNMTVMGGVFNEEGNETPFAETNFAFDPDGADAYFANPFENTFVAPLDVTRKVTWTREQVDEIEIKDDITWWLKNAITAWFDNYDHFREKNICLHDPLAVWLLFNQDSCDWVKSGVRIVLDGEERGRTVLDSSRRECNLALDLKNPEGIALDIWKTLFL